jgi:AcrR family transcriptional regulator
VLDAARVVLGGRPDASMEEIAAAAGVARQTVYAHFPSREALIAAVVERITAEVTAAVAAAEPAAGPAPAALRRWLDACWRLMEDNPMLLNGAVPADPRDDLDSHRPLTGPLVGLLRRGQAAGEFDDRLPADWLAAAVIALGHAAGQQVAAGRMTPARAGAAWRDSALRVCVGAPRQRAR